MLVSAARRLRSRRRTLGFATLCMLLLGAWASGVIAEPDLNTLANTERRALAVARYDHGEVTVGELEDAIAVASPVAQRGALEPPALRALLDRSLRFELSLLEAERRGYRDNEKVREIARQNAVQLLVQRAVNDKVGQQAVPDAALAQQALDALVEAQRREQRLTMHSELLDSIKL
jgi:hypothetical protein